MGGCGSGTSPTTVSAGTLARYCQNALSDRRMKTCLDLTQCRNHVTVVEADLASPECLSLQDAAGGEPRSHSEHVQIVKLFNLEPGVAQLRRESSPGIPAEMVECTVERAVDYRQGRDKEEDISARQQGLVRGAKESGVVLDVLQHIHRDDAVGLKRWRELLQISEPNIDSRVFLKSLAEHRGVAAVGLDQHQLVRLGAAENQLRHSPDSGSRFYCPPADPAGERVNDPVVVVPGFGDRFELGAGI